MYSCLFVLVCAVFRVPLFDVVCVFVLGFVHVCVCSCSLCPCLLAFSFLYSSFMYLFVSFVVVLCWGGGFLFCACSLLRVSVGLRECVACVCVYFC